MNRTVSASSGVDVVCVGAGVMSATLAMPLHKLDPSLRVAVFERLDRAAAESSDAWNSAGTGHSGSASSTTRPSSRTARSTSRAPCVSRWE